MKIKKMLKETIEDGTWLIWFMLIAFSIGFFVIFEIAGNVQKENAAKREAIRQEVSRAEHQVDMVQAPAHEVVEEYYPAEVEELPFGLFTVKELQLYYAAVAAEAIDLPDEGQRLTAVVIFKRWKSKKYPGTIEGVIFQKKPTLQYACTVDGALDKYEDIFNGDVEEYSEEELERLERVAENVNYAIIHEADYPDNLFFQARFHQGEGYAVVSGEHFGLDINEIEREEEA